MAFISCAECGSQISDQASVCPRCGRPQEGAAQPAAWSGDYTPRVPPSQVRTLNVLVSLIFVMVGFHGWFSFIPAHDPGQVKITELVMAEVRGEQRWLFKEEMVSSMYFGALVMIVLGGVSLLTGSFKVVGKLAFCKRCDRQIIAHGGRLWGWKCERCGKSV